MCVCVRVCERERVDIASIPSVLHHVLYAEGGYTSTLFCTYFLGVASWSGEMS